MLSKRKKIIVLAGMVALLVVTGVLNVVLNNRVEREVEGGYDFRTLFQTYRIDRQMTREQSFAFYTATINNASSSPERVAEAEASLLALREVMEVELALEGLIRAIGFEDAFITMATENVNIIVKAETLTEDEANRILAVVVDETGRSPMNVIVIPLSTQR